MHIFVNHEYILFRSLIPDSVARSNETYGRAALPHGATGLSAVCDCGTS